MRDIRNPFKFCDETASIGCVIFVVIIVIVLFMVLFKLKKSAKAKKGSYESFQATQDEKESCKLDCAGSANQELCLSNCDQM